MLRFLDLARVVDEVVYKSRARAIAATRQESDESDKTTLENLIPTAFSDDEHIVWYVPDRTKRRL
jgi:hypothetical protein